MTAYNDTIKKYYPYTSLFNIPTALVDTNMCKSMRDAYKKINEGAVKIIFESNSIVLKCGKEYTRVMIS